jgi:hypothetical protein
LPAIGCLSSLAIVGTMLSVDEQPWVGQQRLPLSLGPSFG